MTPRIMGRTGVECFDELAVLEVDGEEVAESAPRLEREVENDPELVREDGVELELVR
jgi:hypothetical protein